MMKHSLQRTTSGLRTCDLRSNATNVPRPSSLHPSHLYSKPQHTTLICNNPSMTAAIPPAATEQTTSTERKLSVRSFGNQSKSLDDVLFRGSRHPDSEQMGFAQRVAQRAPRTALPRLCLDSGEFRVVPCSPAFEFAMCLSGGEMMAWLLEKLDMLGWRISCRWKFE
jgi:hypothetical protein